MSERILITGATGFIGANLAQCLAEAGAEVTALVRPKSDRWRFALNRKLPCFVECDLGDEAAVRKAVASARPRTIYHLATHGAYPHQRDVARIMTIGCAGTAHVLAAAREAGVRTLVYAGSSGEYGFRGGPISENTPIEPNSYYAVGKAAGSMLLQLAAREDPALRIRIVRFFSVYGRWEGPLRLVPQLVSNGLRGRFPPTLGDPQSARDFVHIDDALDALIRAGRSDTSEPAAVFNIGSGQQTSVEEFVAQARRIFRIAEKPAWNTHSRAPWDARSWVANIEKAKAVLEWRPTRTLECGFAETVAWFRDHAAVLAAYEERQRL